MNRTDLLARRDYALPVRAFAAWIIPGLLGCSAASPPSGNTPDAGSDAMIAPPSPADGGAEASIVADGSTATTDASTDASTDAGPAGLSDSVRQDFYHRTIGARLLPSDWMAALEVPTDTTLFMDPSHLRSLGIVLDPSNASLPIGFSTINITQTYNTPLELTGEYVGLNCSGCHTGEIHYNGQTLLIDGGSGRINIEQFIGQLRQSLEATYSDADKFARFSSQITSGQPYAYSYLYAFMTFFEAVAAPAGVTEGFGRSDTVSKGVSALAIVDPRNTTPITAPVSVPSLWGTQNFDYRHVSGSIRQALARDTAVAVGAGAAVSYVPGPELYDSSVDLNALLFFEQTLATLAPPTWPSNLFGAPDPNAVAAGSAIFQTQCASCHTGTDTGSELVLTSVPFAQIGTDPAAASLLANATVYLTALGVGGDNGVPATQFFQTVTGGIDQQGMTNLGLTPAQQLTYTENGRPNEWRAPLAYKANPLHGIWATPPYLHNGSVQSLNQLLLPGAQRATQFSICVDTEYDPVNVGLANETRSGCFLFDATVAGNLASGHEFGTTLSDGDRMNLLAYLKTL